MESYDQRPARFLQGETNSLDQATAEVIWRLFLAICARWQNVAEPEKMKSRVAAFLLNRIQMDTCYSAEYRDAAQVLDELQARLGSWEAACEFLLSDPGANMAPPSSKLQRARQKVANELCALQLALGGFAAFGGAKNYPGFISGVNGDGPVPYRTLPI
jgi:hypothetical protein